MSREDFVFLCELLMSREEKGLFLSLIQNPRDQATRNAYIDYLKEHDRNETVTLIDKHHYVPGVGTMSSPVSGAIASGHIGTYQISSGSIVSEYSPVRRIISASGGVF